jgi:hypothetical protein
MNQGAFILIVTLLICFISGIHGVASPDSTDRGDIIMNNPHLIKELNNVPGANDVDEANSLSSEFKSQYSANRGDEARKDLVYYVNPKRNSVAFVFYGVTDKNVQDLISKIINDIKVASHTLKTISIQFYRTENIVEDPNKPGVRRRGQEELLRSVTLK